MSVEHIRPIILRVINRLVPSTCYHYGWRCNHILMSHDSGDEQVCQQIEEQIKAGNIICGECEHD